MLFKLFPRSRCALVVTALTACTAAFLPTPVRAQLGKANLILLNRGLQIEGMVQPADFFNLTTYSNANYTSVDIFDNSNPTILGAAPGVSWSRWVNVITNMPPQPGEAPYMNNLLSLEMSDEPNLNDPTIFTNTVNWFLAVESNFPNTVLYVNSYGGQASDSTLGNFINQAHPDMLCFDTYPFLAQYDTNYPNNIGPSLGGPFTQWYSELRRYRAWGMAGNIPVATYRQTFHSVEDYDQRVYRYPSLSEMHLNTSVALAFNVKWLIDFVYNAGATTLFNILPNGYSGDTYTNANYIEEIDINRRALNLGRSLVCLKPVYDLHNPNDSNPPPGPASGNVNFPDGTTTSMMILKGNPGTTNATSEPIGFQDNPAAPNSYSWWESQKNDPYLAGWAVTNKGVNNGGLAGQVFISWFTPIDERLDGTNYTNEIYFLVVNGLTATNGSAADCLQQVHLNFLNKFTNIVMLDPETGLLSTNPVPLINTRRQLDIYLNGGDAALFKMDDGAPFVGHVPPGVAKLNASSQGGNFALNVQGNPGARYQVQYKSALNSTNWTTVTNFVLLSSPTTITTAPASNPAYYRVAGVP